MCDAGKKRNAQTTGCTPCAAGYFAPKDNTAYECAACLAGQYTDDVKTVVKSACKNCTAGRVQPATGQSSCDLCDGKGVSNSGGPMGFQADPGKTTCDTCAAYTKPTSNHDDCVCVNPCPAVRERRQLYVCVCVGGVTGGCEILCVRILRILFCVCDTHV